jgi:hypothetical protein
MESIQLLGITPEQLQSSISKDVKSQLDELKKSFQAKTPDELLTRSETAKLLKINLSSVHNWSKRGILTAFQMGGRVYYKLSQIESTLIELKK